jgi:hypothetical protein
MSRSAVQHLLSVLITDLKYGTQAAAVVSSTQDNAGAADNSSIFHYTEDRDNVMSTSEIVAHSFSASIPEAQVREATASADLHHDYGVDGWMSRSRLLSERKNRSSEGKGTRGSRQTEGSTQKNLRNRTYGSQLLRLLSIMPERRKKNLKRENLQIRGIKRDQ